MRLYGIRDDWEWSWDELNRRIVEKVVGLRSFGREGAEQLPAGLEITIRVASGSLNNVEQFVDDPAFVAQVRSNLLNRLPNTPRHELPEMELVATASTLDGVDVRESRAVARTPARLRLSENGDRIDYVLDPDRTRFTIGRGPWHGPNDRLRNDVTLPSGARFVSRKAAQLTRRGRFLEVSTRDQGQHLTVEWKNSRVRPDRVAASGVLVGVGGVITLEGIEPSERLSLEVLGPELPREES